MALERQDPPLVADEIELLNAFLIFHQQTLLLKIEGLSDVDLRRSVVPSGITLLGLVKHMAYVHRWWFRSVFASEQVDMPWSQEDPDADWRVEPQDTRESIIALYQEEVARAQAIIRAATPEDLARGREKPTSMRWILVHMIEEAARHNGHADILRELIDGQTGE